jgi:hypothetical protein
MKTFGFIKPPARKPVDSYLLARRIAGCQGRNDTILGPSFKQTYLQKEIIVV